MKSHLKTVGDIVSAGIKVVIDVITLALLLVVLGAIVSIHP